MSKLDLTQFEDKHLTNPLLSAYLQLFKTTTGVFPEAIIITKEQGNKFFLNANEIASNYMGVPLELDKKTNEKATIVKTINGILSGMHNSQATEVAAVYRLLENMKAKFIGESGE